MFYRLVAAFLLNAIGSLLAWQSAINGMNLLFACGVLLIGVAGHWCLKD